jgi:HK97 family phage prohead protease
MAPKPDFSGYASKSGIKCSDGRTIMPGAFQHQAGKRVPLVWQHQHDGPQNVLGYAILEHRDDGVYTYGYFNDTQAGKDSKALVQHGDVEALSIYANQLVHSGDKNVNYGMIREVSLVMAGANPGASIDNINLVHGDSVTVLEEEAIIFGEETNQLKYDSESTVRHSDEDNEDEDEDDGKTIAEVFETFNDEQAEAVRHMLSEALGAGGDDTELSIADVFSTLNETQEAVVRHMLSEALGEDTDDDDSDDSDISHAEGTNMAEKTVEDVFNTFSEEQKTVVYFMINEAVNGGSLKQSDGSDALYHQEGSDMGRNVFDNSDQGGKGKGESLSHDQLKTILDDAKKPGSTLKESFLAHAQDYGIENIDILFPDAKALANSPEIIGRRTEWVADVLNGTKHSPFARIKSTAVDLTAEEARAKGYAKGTLKKDEIIKLLKRVTTPGTIYKKQKLDRDDIVDIVDLDVVAWLKAEMRVMLDEELARAVLIGDGRESDDEDKIDEDHIRPIAFDNDMYAHQVQIEGELSPKVIIEQVLRARTNYKGTGTPNFYTTDKVLTDLILLEDKMGRRLYETEAALASALRVGKIVTVEVMDDTPEILGIVVNLADYTLGADRGGAVSMFDDFDIDYNQQKYLIETRVSGALTKPKSAVVLRRSLGTVITPTTPTYNGQTHVLTIPAKDGVIYSIDGQDVAAGDRTIDEHTDVEARPARGYSFPANTARNFSYTYTA